MTDNGTGAALEAAPASNTLSLNGQLVIIERPSGLKASRALAIMKRVSKAFPELTKAWATFNTEYERTHYVELDRAQAMLRYGPQPLTDEHGRVIMYPDRLEDGTPHPRAGEVVLIPSRLESLTEEAWAKAEHRVRLPRSPSLGESIVGILDEVLEVAETHVYELLALFTIPNSEVKSLWKQGGDQLNRRIKEQVDDVVLDAYADELLELAVVCGEVVDANFRTKAATLGARAGNALRLFGITLPAKQTEEPPTEAQTDAEAPQTSDSTGSQTSQETTETSPTSSPPHSPTDTPDSSDGTPSEPSTSPSTSSTESPPASTTSEQS
jgi:hypothetical protein